MTPELSSEERAEFWRKRHDHLLTSYAADKARFEYETFLARLNERAEKSGHRLITGSNGEPAFAPQPMIAKLGGSKEEAAS